MLWNSMQLMTSCSKIKKIKCKNDTNLFQEHENIESEVDEKCLYDLDKLRLGDIHI